MRSGGLQQVAVPCPKGKWIRRIWSKFFLNILLDLGGTYLNFKLHVQEWSRDERTLIGLDVCAVPKTWRIFFALARPHTPGGPKRRHWPYLSFCLKFSKYVQIETANMNHYWPVQVIANGHCMYTTITVYGRLFGWRWVRELYSPDLPKNVCFA